MDVQTITQRAVSSIKAEMNRQDISPFTLAERARIPRSTLLRRLDGISSFTVEELDRIASALEVDVVALMNGSAA